MKSANKPQPIKGRNAIAMSACFMKAGKIPHKNTPRGGARNDMSAFMEEYKEDQEFNPYNNDDN